MKLAKTCDLIALLFLEVYYVFRQFHFPLSYFVGGILVAKNIIEWLIGENPDSVGFEILMKLSSAHDYCITYFSISE
jgi:hypothetical protein